MTTLSRMPTILVVFAAGPAKQWEASSEILFPEESYCSTDLSKKSDHRPMKAVFEVE